MIGVEIIENAVEDAKANAQLNGEFCFENLLTIFRVLCCWLLTTKPLLWTLQIVILFAKCVLFNIPLYGSTHNHIW